MSQRAVVRYLSHPQVNIDPSVPVCEWGLSDIGMARVAALSAAAIRVFSGTTSVFTSPERKARETAEPISAALGLPLVVVEDSHENDRSATGYLPANVFETAADAFFAFPDVSYHGWERAVDAQNRIMNSLKSMLNDAPEGDVLIVGHGAVGTLTLCALHGVPITRDLDQGPGGGGNLFTFDRQSMESQGFWQSIETFLKF